MPRSYRYIPMWAYGPMQKAGGYGAPGGGGITPADLSDLLSWHIAGTGTLNSTGPDTEATDGQEITVWRDQSGNGHDMGTGGGAGPTFRATDGPGGPDFPGGTPCADFVVTSRMFVSSGMPATAQPYHIFCVIKKDDFLANDYIYSLKVGTNNTVYSSTGPNTMTVYAGADGPSTTNVGTTNYHWYEVFYNGASSTLVIDGNAAETGNPSTLNFDAIYLMARSNLANNTDGKVAEFITCNAEVTGTELTGLRAYIADRYGLSTL